MEEAIYTEDYKGYTIEIYPDYNTESPDMWKDDNIFLVHYHRDFNVENDNVTEGEMIALFNDCKHEDESICYEAKEIKKKYHVFFTKAYIHGGVNLALIESGKIFPDEQWDVSICGVVLVKKTEARTRKNAYKMATGLIETWNDYLSGNVYGVEVKKGDNYIKDDNYIYSCWGFYGDYEKSGILDEARSAIDYHKEKEMEKHTKKLKAQIKNNVPLKNRQALS